MPWLITAVAVFCSVVVFQVLTPNLLRSRRTADFASIAARQHGGIAQSSGYDSNAPVARSTVRNGAVGEVLAGVVGGIPGGVPAGQPGSVQPTLDANRKVVRSARIELLVGNIATALEAINGSAKDLGGYASASSVNGTQEHQSGSVTIRIPATRFDEARTRVRGLAKHVDSETVTANDVTMQSVDMEATLRNYRAEEASYLELMKRSGRLKDTLDVAEKLADVRGRIETLDAEYRTLSAQVDMSTISIDMHVLPVTNVTWLDWHPMYRLEESLRDGLESVGTFFAFLATVLLQLPAILLWTATVLVLIQILWRAGRWFFHSLRTTPPANA